MDHIAVEPYDHGWTIDETTHDEYVHLNFSQQGIQHLSASNQLFLSIDRSGRREMQRTVSAVRYIPYGIARKHGRWVNYLTHEWFNKHSFGISRLHLFFSDLLDSGFIGNLYYGVHVILQDPNTVPSIAKAILRDYGETSADRNGDFMKYVTQQDTSIWPYSIHSIRSQWDGCLHVSTPLVNGQYTDPENVIRRLKQLTIDVLPENRDSGEPEDFRIINLFLIVYDINRQSVGGGGPEQSYWLTSTRASELSEWIVNPKSVFPILSTVDSTCLWQCLLYACIRRNTTTLRWFDQLAASYVPDKNSTRNQTKLQRWLVNHVLECVNGTPPHLVECPTSVLSVGRIAAYFGFDKVVILNRQGTVLWKTCDEFHSYRPEANGLQLLLDNGHYQVITCYTMFLPIKECHWCGQRFTHVSSFVTHLDQHKCWTCECKHTFQSFDEWKEHRSNLVSTCPEKRKRMSVSPSEQNLIRFPHDADHKVLYEKKFGGPKALRMERLREHDPSLVRNHLEALFVDIESVVPENGYADSRSELKYQEPYAIGWKRRSDAEPTISYGKQCIREFFQYLDDWYDRIRKDEIQLWVDRANAALCLGEQASSVPKVVRGYKNYPARLLTSWNMLIKSCAKGGFCRFCNETLTVDHGYSIHMHGSQERYVFTDCCIQWWATNTAEKNLATNFNDNAPRVSIWAHNGGRYDWIFIHRFLIESGLLNRCKVTRGNGKYYEIQYRGVFLFRDSLNFMTASLDKLGKDFNVPTLKGVFPYKFVCDMSRIYAIVEGEDNIRTTLPHHYFTISETVDGPMGFTRKRPMTEDEYVDFFTERQWIYDVHKESVMYLSADIQCLSQVMETFRQGWKDMPCQPELFKYCTIGQMCHSYFLEKYLPVRSYPTLDVMEDDFIRRSLFGGRTEVFQRIAPQQPIHYVDVNSLYPFVMESRHLPTGNPIWNFCDDDERIGLFQSSEYCTQVIGHSTLDHIRDLLNLCSEQIYGFVEVDVVCDPMQLFPVLPERSHGKNMFSNTTKLKSVYYSEEIKFAVQRGARVVKVHAYCEWKRSKIYAKLIQVLKAEKMRGEGKDVNGQPIPNCPKNPALRAAAKLAQNALYGKSLQYINESVQIVDNQEDLFRMVADGNSRVTLHPIYSSDKGDVIEVTVQSDKPKIQKRSCSAIGTAILAEARMVLYSYFEEVQRVNGTILYCDTDSIVFSGSEPLPSDCLHDSLYGKMKVEIDPNDIEIGGFIALAPKCYAFKLKDKTPYVKCKGVNLASNIEEEPDSPIDALLMEADKHEMMETVCLANELNIDDMIGGLSYDNLFRLVTGEAKGIVTSQLQFVKTKDRHVAAVDSIKLLKDSFDKRFLLDNGTSVPWNDYNRSIMESVKARDVSAVSNFFRHGTVQEIRYIMDKHQCDWLQCIFNGWLQSDESNSLLYKAEYNLW